MVNKKRGDAKIVFAGPYWASQGGYLLFPAPVFILPYVPLKCVNCKLYTNNFTVTHAFLNVKLPTAQKKRSVLLGAGLPEGAHHNYTLLQYSFITKEVENETLAFKTLATAHNWMLEKSLALFEFSVGAKNNTIYICIPPLRPF